MEMSRLTRDGTAEPVSRDQILRHARGQGNIDFPCSANHEQDWQPYPVDPYSAICDDHTYIHRQIHTYIHTCHIMVTSATQTERDSNREKNFARSNQPRTCTVCKLCRQIKQPIILGNLYQFSVEIMYHLVSSYYLVQN